MVSGCIYKIVIIRLIEKLNPKKYAVIQWHTQSGNITTNLKVKIDFTLPELSATKILTWGYHVYDSAKGRYDIIFGRDLLTALVLNIEFSGHVIEEYYGHLKGSTAPMVDMGMY